MLNEINISGLFKSKGYKEQSFYGLYADRNFQFI